jgi:lysophospholipase L1-like esterase
MVQVEQGYIPIRFSQKQMVVYQQSEVFELRSLCPSGICLDMETDSTYIRLTYSIDKGSTRDWIYFDVYVNDVLIKSIGNQPIDENDGDILFEISDKKHAFNRITIYFPHNVSIILKAVSVSEGAQVNAIPKHQKNLLCLGDSITQGMDSIKPSNTYPIQLSRFLEMNLLNQGVGGYYFEADSIDPELPYKPDIITVAYGTNDWNRSDSIEAFRNDCAAYIEKLVNVFKNATVYVITPYWRNNLDEVKHTGTLHDISNAICEACESYENVYIINGTKMIPHLDEYFADEVHPTDEGFLHIVLNILKETLKFKVR